MRGRRQRREGAAPASVPITHVGAPALELKVSVDREQEKNESFHIRHMDRLFILALFGILTVSLVLVFALGTNAYQSLEQARTSGQQVRLQSSLLATTVRAMDEAGAASVGKGPEGPALVMTEQAGQDRYQIRLYHYQGQLVQEYAAAGMPYDPESATVLCRTQQFSFSIDHDLITLVTDAGKTYVALRSGGGERS